MVQGVPPATRVDVLHRTGQWCPGRRIGSVVAYDLPILPVHQLVGRPTVDRCYLLLDEGVQLTQPVLFAGDLEGWWYVDLVEVDQTEDGLVVRDLYADLLFPPDADRYAVLDLDELGEALVAGHLSAAECGVVLTRTQCFIDRYLPHPEQPHLTRAAFPPPPVDVLQALPNLLDDLGP